MVQFDQLKLGCIAGYCLNVIFKFQTGKTYRIIQIDDQCEISAQKAGHVNRIFRPKADFAKYLHVRDFDVILRQAHHVVWRKIIHIVLAQNNQNGLVFV